MVFAYSLTQLAPFSLGLHSSSKLSSPEQHHAAPMVSDIARNAKDSFKESRLILFSLMMHCKFTSVTWYRKNCWLFPLGELLSNFEVPHLWWQFIHRIFHLPEMYNLCTDTTRCLPGSPTVPPWKTWDAGMLSQDASGKLKFKRFMVGCRFKLEWSFLVIVGGWGGKDRTFQFTDTKSALITNFFTPFFLHFGFFPDC